MGASSLPAALGKHVIYCPHNSLRLEVNFLTSVLQLRKLGIQDFPWSMQGNKVISRIRFWTWHCLITKPVLILSLGSFLQYSPDIGMLS